MRVLELHAVVAENKQHVVNPQLLYWSGPCFLPDVEWMLISILLFSQTLGTSLHRPCPYELSVIKDVCKQVSPSAAHQAINLADLEMVCLGEEQL